MAWIRGFQPARAYEEKVGFEVHTDARNGDYRWLTVQHPDQPSFQLGLFEPGPPTVDEATAQSLREALSWLSAPERVEVAADRELLDQLASLPQVEAVSNQ